MKKLTLFFLLMTLSLFGNAQVTIVVQSRATILINTDEVVPSPIGALQTGVVIEWKSGFGFEAMATRNHLRQTGLGIYGSYQPWKKLLVKKPSFKLGVGTKTILEGIKLWEDIDVQSIAFGQGIGCKMILGKKARWAIGLNIVGDYKFIRLNLPNGNRVNRHFWEARATLGVSYKIYSH